MKFLTFMIYTVKPLKRNTRNMKPKRKRVKFGRIISRQLICGNKCSRCFSKRDIHGLLSRIPVMSVVRRITLESYIAPTSVPKLLSILELMKLQFATLARSYWTPILKKMDLLITTSYVRLFRSQFVP